MANITLLPKSLHASSIKNFRPISYCFTVYKFISNILARRLHVVIGDIVDLSQTRFFRSRQKLDDILHAYELIKRYMRKGLTPRGMIKLDFMNSYEINLYR